ncbi:hypothetical protein J6590_072180 [Homalodisca vitripennis]|nr:hypothetical protein J6590_072180 [Homalodisca vitripennis]
MSDNIVNHPSELDRQLDVDLSDDDWPDVSSIFSDDTDVDPTYRPTISDSDDEEMPFLVSYLLLTVTPPLGLLRTMTNRPHDRILSTDTSDFFTTSTRRRDGRKYLNLIILEEEKACAD